MEPASLLEWLRQQGVEFRAPELLWALVLTPLFLVFYAAARRARRRVAGAFRVIGARQPPRRLEAVGRTLAITLLLTGLAGLVVGFARPVLPLDTPRDRATVVLVVDASTTLRATDVSPTRFEAAKGLARAAVAALPEHLQVSLVGYAGSAYILLPPTDDHGAVGPALSRMRTAEGAALGDGLAVAIAAVPLLDDPADVAAGGGAGGAGGGAGAPKAPAAIVLISSGELSGGQPLPEPLRSATEAGIPVHTVPVGPRPGAEQRAPFDPTVLQQIAQASGGRYLASPTRTTWRELYQQIDSAVIVERRPQEIGHYIGTGALAVAGLAMLLSLAATRRLV
jgi:Ca-activated chloride channel family protein